jgi:hypothetical protein
VSDYGNVGTKDLVPGTLRGYRAWSLGTRSPGLRSVTMAYDWYPGHHLPATCFHYSSQVVVMGPKDEVTVWGPSHSAPAVRCSCGYYATYNLDDLYVCRAWARNIDNTVVGTVRAHGSVMLGTIGFRAQYMEIEALVNSSPLIAEKAAAYGVPMVPSFEVLVSQYPPSNVDELIGAPRANV